MALWREAPLAGVACLALSQALVLYPTLRPNVQWLGPVLTRFDTEGSEVWLTIDDGPTADTPELLDLLDRHGARATFFVKGTLAEASPDAVRAILARGHAVANHSQTHPQAIWWCALPGRIATEIDRCSEVLSRHTGGRISLFRAPVGMKNPFVHPALARRSMQLVGWSARGFDTVASDPEGVFARILPDLRPGAIVMLHQGRNHSLRVIDHVLTELAARGYTCVIPAPAQLRR